jgi:hypothetical protein
MLIGKQAVRRMRIVLCKVRPIIEKFPDPNAWPQTGSMPDASPFNTEYPVILVKPIESAPPASCNPPSLPRHNTDTIALIYTTQFKAAMGPAIRNSFLNSSIICIQSERHSAKLSTVRFRTPIRQD